MKSILIIAALAVSFSALAAEVSLYSKLDGKECFVSKNKVTRSVNFPGQKFSYKTTANFESEGLEAVAKKAAELSTGRTYGVGLVMTVTIDGVTSTLHSDDSKEAIQLSALLGNVCN